MTNIQQTAYFLEKFENPSPQTFFIDPFIFIVKTEKKKT